MLTVGLQVSLTDLKKVLQNRRLIITTGLLNLLAAPVCTFLLLQWFGITGPVAIALLLLAASPGAPFAPRIVEIGRGDLAFATMAVVLLSLIAVFSGPITAQLVLASDSQSLIIPWRLILVLIIFQLLPLATGLWVHTRKAKLAIRLVRPFHLFSNLLIIALAVVSILEFGDQFWQFRSSDWRTMLAITLIWMALGLLHRGNGQLVRHTEQLLIPARNIGLALFLALQGFGGTEVVIPLLAQGAISLFVVPGIGRILHFWGFVNNSSRNT